MSVLRNIVTARAGLAVALVAAPMIAEAQVVAPGTNPRAPTTNPAPTTQPTPTSAASKTAQEEVRNDLPFLNEAAGANLLEIRLGQLALTRASNPAVKQFAQRMVTDHTRFQQELSSLVSRNGVTLNAALNSEHYEKINHLQNLSGQQFDQDYMSMMIQDHQKDVANFENQSRDADSPQVRELATRSLPLLRQHLSLAQQIGSQVNVQVAGTPPSRRPTQNGQVTNPSAQPSAERNNNANFRADQRFIQNVTADNKLEASLGRLAEKKARSSAVKQLGERIAADHDRLQNEWVTMASKKGEAFTPGMGKNHRAKLIELEKLSGRAFDRAYVTRVIRDHRDYIAYFEKEGRAARSSQVRELVKRELPVLRSHFNQARRIADEVGADVNATNERASK